MSLKNICKQGIGIGLTLLLENGCVTMTAQERQIKQSKDLLGEQSQLVFMEEGYITSKAGWNSFIALLGVYTGELPLWKKTKGNTIEYFTAGTTHPIRYPNEKKELMAEADTNYDKILTREELAQLQMKVYAEKAKEK